MNHELAKKLKENGYPQEMKFRDSNCECEERYIDGMYIPTLSELIEACGNDFGGIICNKVLGENYYKAFQGLYMIAPEPARNFHNFIKGIQIHASTPEEAVANLWLEINKK